MKNTILFFCLTFIFACGNNKTTTPENHGPEEAAQDDLILLSPEQAKLAGLVFGDFTIKNIPQELKVNAELVVHQENMAVVTAFSDGILSELRTTLNAAVRKGQVLAMVRKPGLLDLQQEFLENRDQLSFLQNEYDRYKSLKDADATAARNFQKAEAELRAAKTTGQVLAAKLRQYQIDPEELTPANLSTQLALTAPVSGIVTAIRTNVGAAVQHGSPVCEVTDMSQMHADLWVFENDILKVKNGQRVRVNFPADPMKTYPAEIYSIDKVLDPEKRAVRVHARLEGGPAGQVNFVNGAFLEAHIAIAAGIGTRALPSAAVVREGDEDVIFILQREVKEGSFFKKIQVKKGGGAEGFVTVEPVGPFPEGAKIVLEGAYYISAQGAGIEVEE